MTLKRSKWKQKHIPIVYKFEEQAEATREQNKLYWDALALPKRKTMIKTQKQRRDGRTREYQKACKEVDKRDHRQCQHPGCNCRVIQHHHGTYRSHGGRDRVEELVSLCYPHHQGDESPHQSEEWRKYWVKWLEERYPEYWNDRIKQEVAR